MRSNYRRIGDCIQLVDKRNTGLKVDRLLGLSITKEFIPSVANTIGTDMENYKIIRKNQFACSTMQVRRDKKMPVALLRDYDEAIISAAYPVFEVKDPEFLLPEYLMMWFEREEFDREACFYAVGGVRGSIEWDDFCNMQFPVPTIEKQKDIVREYKVLTKRIEITNKLIEKLEETAQTVYKQWFVDFEFPDENGNPYKSSGGEMVFCEEVQKYIPAGFNLLVLGDCVEFLNGFGFSSEDLLSFGTNECYKVFKMGNIKKGGGLNKESTKSWIKKSKCISLDKYVLKKCDLLMAMTDMKDNIGILGNTAIMDIDDSFILNQRVGLLRSNNVFEISSKHLYILTNTESFLKDLRSRANRGVQVNLTKNEILSSKIIIPFKELNIKFNAITEPLFDFISNSEFELEYIKKTVEILLSRLATLEG